MIKNKNILITGGNSGIGFFAVINLLNKLFLLRLGLYISSNICNESRLIIIKLLKY